MVQNGSQRRASTDTRRLPRWRRPTSLCLATPRPVVQDYQFSMLIDFSLLDCDDPRFPAECKPSDEGVG